MINISLPALPKCSRNSGFIFHEKRFFILVLSIWYILYIGCSFCHRISSLHIVYFLGPPLIFNTTLPGLERKQCTSTLNVQIPIQNKKGVILSPHPTVGANRRIEKQKDKKVNKAKLYKPVPIKMNSFV